MARGVLFQRSECMCLNMFHLARLPNLLSFVADAAVALLPDVVGRSAFVSMSNSAVAAVIAGVESAASEAKPAVSDSAFELPSASGSLSASASDSAPAGEETSVAGKLCASALGSDSSPAELEAASLSAPAQGEGGGAIEGEGSDESHDAILAWQQTEQADLGLRA